MVQAILKTASKHSILPAQTVTTVTPLKLYLHFKPFLVFQETIVGLCIFANCLIQVRATTYFGIFICIGPIILMFLENMWVRTHPSFYLTPNDVYRILKITSQFSINDPCSFLCWATAKWSITFQVQNSK